MKTIKTPKTTINPSTLVGSRVSTPPVGAASPVPPVARPLPSLPKGSPAKVEPPASAGGKVSVNVTRTSEATLASDDTLEPKGAFPSWCVPGASAIVIINDAGEAKAIKISILAVTGEAIIGDDGTFATSGEMVSVSHPRDVFPATSKGRASAEARTVEANAGIRLQRAWTEARAAIVAGVSNTKDEARLVAAMSSLPRVDRARVSFALTGSAKASPEACVAAWEAKGSGTSPESKATREAARTTLRAFRAEFPTLEADVQTWGSMACLGVWGYPPAKKAKATPEATPAKVAKKAKKSGVAA